MQIAGVTRIHTNNQSNKQTNKHLERQVSNLRTVQIVSHAAHI